MSGSADFELTAEDQVAAYRSHTRRLSGWFGLLFLDVGLLLAAFDLNRRIPLETDWLLWLVVAIGVYFVIWELVLQAAVIRRQFRQSMGMRSPLRARWDEQALEIDTDTSDARYEWKQFHRWNASKTTLLLYRDAGFFIPIPRRAVGDAGIAEMTAALKAAGVRQR